MKLHQVTDDNVIFVAPVSVNMILMAKCALMLVVFEIAMHLYELLAAVMLVKILPLGS